MFFITNICSASIKLILHNQWYKKDLKKKMESREIVNKPVLSYDCDSQSVK